MVYLLVGDIGIFIIVPLLTDQEIAYKGNIFILLFSEIFV